MTWLVDKVFPACQFNDVISDCHYVHEADLVFQQATDLRKEEQTTEVFGRWQTEVYIPPPAVDVSICITQVSFIYCNMGLVGGLEWVFCYFYI